MSNKSNLFNPTESQKAANDYQLAKEIIDNYSGQGVDRERTSNFFENANLHAGRWPAMDQLTTGMEMSIGGESFSIGATGIKHYDKIGQITRGHHGTMIAAPFIPIIKDISSKSKTMRDRLRLEAVKDSMYRKYIAPKEALLTKKFLLENNIENPYDMAPEDQEQMQMQIQKKIQEETPDEILSILQKSKTPDEQVCQLLFNYGATQEKIKNKFDIGGEFAVISGEEYYRVGIYNKYPKMEALIPAYLTWGGSSSCEFVEDGTWACYSNYISIEDAIAKYGLDFLGGDINNLEKYFDPSYTYGSYTGNHSSNRIDPREKELVDIIGTDPVLRETNFLTRDGQNLLNAVWSKIGGYTQHYKIQEHYVTWRWTTRMKVVTRLVNGKKKDYILSGHYTKNPSVDLKVRTIIVPQVWHGTKLGDAYHKIEPLPYQYDSIDNPWYPKLSIIGGKYNTLMGTTKNYSYVDNGKIWNFRFNDLQAKIADIESTDKGRIMMLTLNAKPDGMTWEDWLKGIFTTRIGLIANRTETMDKDRKLIDSFDMSSLSDAVGYMNKLVYTEQELMKSMYYSEAMSGQIGQYATNQNSALQIDASNRQNLAFMNRHRIIMQNASSAFLKYALIAYKDNEIVKNAVLDDFLKTHYELNMQNEDISQYALALVDTMSEVQAVTKMRDLAMAMVQNGLIGLNDISRLFSASSTAEIQDIFDEAVERQEKQNEKAQRNTMEQQQQQAALMKQIEELKQQYDSLQRQLDREVKIKLAEINSHLLSNANDVDNDKIADATQRAILEIAAKEKMHNDKMEVERLKLGLK